MKIPAPIGVFSGWAGLGRFWIGILLLFWITVAILWSLGPPERRPAPNPAESHHAESQHAESHHAEARPAPDSRAETQRLAENPTRQTGAPGASLRPGRATPGPLAAPDPALLEPYDAGQQLPRIAADGRAPMAVYAAGFDPSSRRPRVGLLIAGIGASDSDSVNAMKALPEGITFAIDPYAANLSHLLDLARMGGQEYLLSIPMEPQGYPANDPDDRHALMTALPPLENQKRLRAILARVQGYAGITNAFGQMHGERLSGVPGQFDQVLDEAAHRGLLFADARPGVPAAPYAWNRAIDLVIDDHPDPATLDQQLDKLSHIALDKGSALGLVSVPRPATIDRIAAWTNGLAAKGLALAPVSALARPPARQEDSQ